MDKNTYFALKTIKELVEDGIKFVKSDKIDATAQNWVDYSQKIVELSTKDIDSSIYLNYLRLLISVQDNDISAKQKVTTCLKYLMEVLRIILKQKSD
jgi:hypothetical protein